MFTKHKQTRVIFTSGYTLLRRHIERHADRHIEVDADYLWHASLGPYTLGWHMARIGYARVSTIDQDLDGQLARLKLEGCAIIRSEKASAASREGRPELATVIEFLRQGDELVVARLDRLGRDTRDVLNIVHECEQRGAFVTVLDPHISTRGDMGHVVITVLGMVAQMERRFIKERQREGIERAKAEGRYVGGKQRIDREAVSARKAAGESVSQIAETLGCSRMQVYRVLQAARWGPLCADFVEEVPAVAVRGCGLKLPAATARLGDSLRLEPVVGWDELGETMIVGKMHQQLASDIESVREIVSRHMGDW